MLNISAEQAAEQETQTAFDKIDVKQSAKSRQISKAQDKSTTISSTLPAIANPSSKRISPSNKKVVPSPRNGTAEVAYVSPLVQQMRDRYKQIISTQQSAGTTTT